MTTPVARRTPEARLILRDGPRAGTAFPLILDVTLVGRIDSAALVLDENTISRLHARVSVRPDGVYVEDLGSRDGTWVNGVAVNGAVKLAGGDVLAFGDVVFVFETEASTS